MMIPACAGVMQGDLQMYLILIVTGDRLDWHSIVQSREAVDEVFDQLRSREDIQAAMAIELFARI